MSTINDRTDAFIAKHDLPDTDEFRNFLGDFVSGCWGDHFKIVSGETIPDDKKSSAKVSKADKIDDPTDCKERDDLRNCTAGTLNEFSKTNGLRVGGNKKEIMDRVWRFLQGNNSEEDISPRTKPKKEKKINEKHDCYGCTSKGTPCAVAATVEIDNYWFCWRHEETAAEIIESKESKPVEKKPVEKKLVEKKPIEKKPVEKKPVEKKPVEKKKKVELETDDSDNGSSSKKKSSGKKSKKEEIVVVLESESEEEEVDEEEEIETDEE